MAKHNMLQAHARITLCEDGDQPGWARASIMHEHTYLADEKRVIVRHGEGVHHRLTHLRAQPDDRDIGSACRTEAVPNLELSRCPPAGIGEVGIPVHPEGVV